MMKTAQVALWIGAWLAPALAIDYPGGWLPSPPKQECVDICVNSKAKPTCFTGQPECLAKAQAPGDFDYLLLEQLFIPQFCRDLLQGVDPTVSHQNVNPFPHGLRCQENMAKTELTIHGLWPNYDDGYPACCNVSETIANRPYHAAQFAHRHPELLEQMSAQWIDPTQSNAFETLCEIYNHEFQKHGICYAAYGRDYEQAAVTYFHATLRAAQVVSSATLQINAWAQGPSHQAPSLASIHALYEKKVQVFCSAVDGVNQLSAIRSCYEKPANTSSTGPFKQLDCAPPKPYGPFALCDGQQPLTLFPYSAPVASC